MGDVPLDLGTRLLDAQELALRLGVTREWVYDHATELGALRLGSGVRPRLRFDPRQVALALEDGLGSGRRSRLRTNRFRRQPRPTTDVELLPIGGVRSTQTTGGK